MSHPTLSRRLHVDLRRVGSSSCRA
ncbi:putative leader peptide [Geodermatophilus sp. Leaf369]